MFYLTPQQRIHYSMQRKILEKKKRNGSGDRSGTNYRLKSVSTWLDIFEPIASNKRFLFLAQQLEIVPHTHPSQSSGIQQGHQLYSAGASSPHHIREHELSPSAMLQWASQIHCNGLEELKKRGSMLLFAANATPGPYKKKWINN